MSKQLPTEAEWEKAVSWDAQANNHRTYPWVDDELTAQRFDCVGVARRNTARLRRFVGWVEGRETQQSPDNVGLPCRKQATFLNPTYPGVIFRLNREVL